MTESIAEQAAHWLLELENPDTQALRDFAAWLQSSPRHVEEFLLATAVWQEFEHLDPARQLDIRRLVEDARDNVTPLPALSGKDSTAAIEGSQRYRARLSRRLLVAAAAALVIALGVWIFKEAGPREYTTALGEQRAFKLSDGSVLYLNTRSRVEVTYSRDARLVRLMEGEAMFAVEHDAGRPFRVLAGTTVIQAVGTRFNVYRSNAGTTVSVVEGVVQISPQAAVTPNANPAPPRVSAGEQARVSEAGVIVTRTVPDLAQLVAWRERLLVFRGDSLAAVAAEFNRYNSLQLRVEGDTARNKHITGVFSADDPRSFVLFLERDANLRITTQGDEILIQPR